MTLDEENARLQEEIDMLRDYIAKHQDLWNNTMLELAAYQAAEGKQGTGHRNAPANT